MSTGAARAAVRWWPTLAVAAMLGIGAWALARYAPVPEGAQVGRRAPDVMVAHVDRGDSVGLRSGYAGHVTLINIWATSCVPCRTEMPALERLYQHAKDRGFRVAAVSVDDGAPAGVLAFARGLGLSFDILQDRSGRVERAFQAIGIPESVVIDRRGRIVYTRLGAEAWDSAASRARIDELLAGGD